MFSHNQEGKSSVFIIIIAAALVLLLVFALSKIIPRPDLSSPLIAKPTPTGQTSSASPSPSANTYVNSTYGFSLDLPEDWQSTESQVTQPPRLFFAEFGPSNSDIRLNLEIKDQPADMSIATFRSEAKAANIRIIHEREVRIGKDYGKQITLRQGTTDTYYRFFEQSNRTYILSGPDTTVMDSFSLTLPVSPR